MIWLITLTVMPMNGFHMQRYLTKHRRVIHLVVGMLRGRRGRGVAGVVLPSVLHTLLLVRLLVETEKRRRPCAEAVGLPEHSQRELLQIKSTHVHCVFR